MKIVPDDVLAAQLRRRSGAAPGSATSPAGAERSRALSAAISDRVRDEQQVRAFPWSRLREPLLLRGRSSTAPVAASLGVAAVIVVLAAASLPGRLAGPAPSASAEGPSWYLSTAELARVVRETETTGVNIGKTVVADVAFETIAVACPLPPDVVQGGSCPVETVIAGTDPAIPVTNARLPIACPSPANPAVCYALPSPGSTALTIEQGSVIYVGTVDLETTDHTPWTVGQYLTTSTYGTQLALVDGWLSVSPPPPCPMPPDGVDPNEPFGCGAASWLTDDAFQPTTGAAGSAVTAEPGRGIRVQNNAYETFVPSGSVVDASGFPAARRGLFVLTPADPPGQCFLCATGVARIVARVDAVTVPPAPLVTPSAVPTSRPLPTAAPSWLVDGGGLGGLVSGAESGIGIGRIVVATVALDWAPGCQPSPAGVRCEVVVAGSDPPITVRNVPVAQPCPSGATCTQPLLPNALPAGRTFAFRIDGDGSVEWLAAVPAGGTTWSFDQFHQLLAGLAPGAPEAEEVYAVDGWVLASAAEFDCAIQLSDPLFGCIGNHPYWLLGASIADGSRNQAPSGSIRLRNDLPFAPDHAVRAVLLLRPVPDPGSCSFCAFPPVAADVVGSLEPNLEIPEQPAPSPTPTETVVPTVDPLATKALEVATLFETARASGDFKSAWAILGPATRKVFGSEATFAKQEADYNATGAAVFAISPPSNDPSFLAPSELGSASGEFVPSTAWYVAINHPNVVGASAGLEGLVVAESIDGGWRVWIVH